MLLAHGTGRASTDENIPDQLGTSVCESPCLALVWSGRGQRPSQPGSVIKKKKKNCLHHINMADKLMINRKELLVEAREELNE